MFLQDYYTWKSVQEYNPEICLLFLQLKIIVYVVFVQPHFTAVLISSFDHSSLKALLSRFSSAGR